jgi:hypothetical protein
MKNVQSPINVGKAPQIVANTDYSHTYDNIKAEEDEKAKDNRELPYEINSFPQYLGTMIGMCNDMQTLLLNASTKDTLKTKLIETQLELINDIKAKIIELNISIYDLKL